MRTVHKTGYHEHTNILFVRSNILKVVDLINFKILQIMYKAKHNLLPFTIQKMFSERDGRYNLRREMNFKIMNRRTCLKSRCITSKGVELWNAQNEELKSSTSLKHFKRKYRLQTLVQYEKLEKNIT